jgi:phage tail-like protein
MQEFSTLWTSLRLRTGRKAAPARKPRRPSKQDIAKKEGSPMAGGQRIDPYLNFRFRVEIDGIQQAGFMECTGLGSQVEVVEYREGGDNATVRKLPGRVSYPDITLKWGITDSQELYKWHLAVIQGKLDRKAGSVVLLDAQGQEKLRWNFFNAWPSKWTGPTLNAKGNDVAIEELTLTCERQEQAL